MNTVISAFQFEIRYNHILNFSQIARKIVAPFVKLAKNVRIDNQSSINEQIILEFEDENYIIVISWDRIFLKGQDNIDTFLSNNSPIQTPFMTILDRLIELDEFGSIKNVLFAINYIREIKGHDSNSLHGIFTEKFFSADARKILDSANDMAVVIEDNNPNSKTTISFGPYKGSFELLKRPLTPLNVNKLGDLDFSGVMLEYRKGYSTKKVNFDDFKEMISTSNKIFEKTWKTL